MTITTPKDFILYVIQAWVPFMNNYKRTLRSDVQGLPTNDIRYLTNVLMRTLITSIVRQLQKKYVNAETQKIKLKFDDAECVALYVMLIKIPIDYSNIYEQQIRNQWIEYLDQRLLEINFIIDDDLPSGNLLNFMPQA